MARKRIEKPTWSKKSRHKGKACRRGEAIYYEERKKPINIMLTPTALEIVKNLALEQKVSRSEMIERLLRSHAQKAALHNDGMNYTMEE